MKKPKIVVVPTQWMVLCRHYMMQGGLFDYGTADIIDYFDTFEQADTRAKKVYNDNKGQIDLHVYILRCTKTYVNGGVAWSPIQKQEVMEVMEKQKDNKKE